MLVRGYRTCHGMSWSETCPRPLQIRRSWLLPVSFESYLACPTKCYLQSIRELGIESDFTIWNETRSESYRLDGIQRIKVDHSQTIDGGEPDPGHWKHALWDFAFNQTVRTQNCEASLHAVQRIPLEGNGPIVPVHSDPLCSGEQTVPLRQTDGWIRSTRSLKGLGGKGRYGENHPRGQGGNL